MHTYADRLTDVRVGQDGRVDCFGRKSHDSGHRVSGGKNRDRLARHIPCLERENRRRFGRAANGENANLLSDEIFGFADLLLRHKAVRKRIKRTGYHHEICALIDGVDRCRRVHLGKVEAASL